MSTIIDTRLNQLIPPNDETIFNAARYSLLSPGKRLRPQLALAVTASLGSDPALVLDPACAIEMIHTYSLIHDDLPCMDNDDLRRNKPTLHKVYGDAMALLAGDYLLTLAFEVIAKASRLTAEQKLQMIQTISSYSGALGMIGGQVIDIESEKKKIDEATLLRMHYGKTSALMIASLQVGYIASSQAVNRSITLLLKSIGKDLGFAYQLQDDLFNVISSTSILGKKVGSDAIRGKSTAIAVYGRQGTEEKLKNLEHSIFEKLEKLSANGSELTTLIQNIFQRNY